MHALKREIKEKVSIDFEKPRHEGDYGTKIESLSYSLALTLKDLIAQGFCNVFKCINSISAHILYRFIGTGNFYKRASCMVMFSLLRTCKKTMACLEYF